MSLDAPVRTLILGAAGRDFHNFNIVYRDDPETNVVAFTATQIPGIDARSYPAALAGPRYPNGIPIHAEGDLENLCAQLRVQRVVFAYSDVTHERVMHLGSRALACGADFVLLGPAATMLATNVPVLAVSAMRTGSGKSQIARAAAGWLREMGKRVVAIRHPMPYGDLTAQRVQRLASMADLDAAECTVEEREEYEPHIAQGGVIFAGVDYGAILEQAEREADIIVWDGGNNDFPFYRPALHLAVADALRPEQAAQYHPGEAVLRMADVIVVNKVDAASPAQIAEIESSVRALNPRARLVRAASPVVIERAGELRGRRAIVVEDGPTITHGGMPYGAGFVAAQRAGATIVDPRPFAVGGMAALYATFPHIGAVLPAAGYSAEQIRDLAATINTADADAVVLATPMDLGHLALLRPPVYRARYQFAEADEPGLEDLVRQWARSLG